MQVVPAIVGSRSAARSRSPRCPDMFALPLPSQRPIIQAMGVRSGCKSAERSNDICSTVGSGASRAHDKRISMISKTAHGGDTAHQQHRKVKDSDMAEVWYPAPALVGRRITWISTSLRSMIVQAVT